MSKCRRKYRVKTWCFSLCTEAGWAGFGRKCADNTLNNGLNYEFSCVNGEKDTSY